jgi:hypothetical protein
MRCRLITMLCMASVCCGIGCTQDNVATPGQTIVVPPVLVEFTTPKDMRGLAMLVPMSYKGKQYMFVVDTGSNGVLLDECFRQDLKPLPKQPSSQPSPKCDGVVFSPQLYECPDLFLGSLNIRPSGPVMVADVSTFCSMSGHQVSGVIGMNVLRYFVVEMDVANGITRIKASTQHPQGGSVIPLEYKWGVPFITAQLENEQPVHMLVDSGCVGFGKISQELLSSASMRATSTRKESRFGVNRDGILERHEIDVVDLLKLKVGQTTYRQVPVIVGEPSIMGLGLLSCHTVIFDFPACRMHLLGAHSPVLLSRPNVAGLVLAKEGGMIVVRDVLPRGPALEAGIRRGDVVLKINDVEAESLDVAGAGSLLRSEESRTVNLTIQRDSREFRVSLLLKDFGALGCEASSRLIVESE